MSSALFCGTFICVKDSAMDFPLCLCILSFTVLVPPPPDLVNKDVPREKQTWLQRSVLPAKIWLGYCGLLAAKIKQLCRAKNFEIERAGGIRNMLQKWKQQDLAKSLI